jgi:hypothetical protein
LASDLLVALAILLTPEDVGAGRICSVVFDAGGVGRWRGEVVGVVHEDEKLVDLGQLEQPLYGLVTADYGEVVAVGVGVFVLPEELVQAGRVHE